MPKKGTDNVFAARESLIPDQRHVGEKGRLYPFSASCYAMGRVLEIGDAS
jgi:hypothetical protein